MESFLSRVKLPPSPGRHMPCFLSVNTGNGKLKNDVFFAQRSLIESYILVL